MKKVLVWITCCTVLLFCAVSAVSENSIDIFDDSFMLENNLIDKNGRRLYFSSMDWSGNVLYACMNDMCVYTYNIEGTLEMLCELPQPPENINRIYNSMTKVETEQLHNTVTYVVAYEGTLYGYNIYSGKFGRIDNEGIHWNEQLLDFQCLFIPGEFFPQIVTKSFLTEKELFLLVLLNEPINKYTDFAIFGFDLSSGKSRRIVVDGLYNANRMDNDKLLCLQTDGAKYHLSTLNLFTGEIDDVNVPVDIKSITSDISGLAYDKNTDSIFLAGNNLVYRSTAGNAFSAIAKIYTEYIYPQVKAWALPDGRYVLLYDGMHIRGEDEAIMAH